MPDGKVNPSPKGKLDEFRNRIKCFAFRRFDDFLRHPDKEEDDARNVFVNDANGNERVGGRGGKGERW